MHQRGLAWTREPLLWSTTGLEGTLRAGDPPGSDSWNCGGDVGSANCPLVRLPRAAPSGDKPPQGLSERGGSGSLLSPSTPSMDDGPCGRHRPPGGDENPAEPKLTFGSCCAGCCCCSARSCSARKSACCLLSMAASRSSSDAAAPDGGSPAVALWARPSAASTAARRASSLSGRASEAAARWGRAAPSALALRATSATPRGAVERAAVSWTTRSPPLLLARSPLSDPGSKRLCDVSVRSMADKAEIASGREATAHDYKYEKSFLNCRKHHMQVLLCAPATASETKESRPTGHGDGLGGGRPDRALRTAASAVISKPCPA